MGPQVQALKEVSVITILMIAVTFSGVYDNVLTENGPDHYAEKYGWLGLFPGIIPMPLNTLINLAYTVVGLVWLYRINKAKHLSASTIYVISVFNWMAVLYSFIQLARLVTQTHHWAVMDQWYTLPFFAWTLVMACTLQYGSSRKLEIFVIFISLASYSLSLVNDIGFELALGCHILLAVLSGLISHSRFYNDKVTYYMAMSFLSCAGFVVLKLLDHELPKWHWIFTIVSGHFLSKMCDFMQIYYVNGFFTACWEVQYRKLLKQE